MGAAVHAGLGAVREISVPVSHSLCEPKTLKNEVLKNKSKATSLVRRKPGAPPEVIRKLRPQGKNKTKNKTKQKTWSFF